MPITPPKGSILHAETHPHFAILSLRASHDPSWIDFRASTVRRDMAPMSSRYPIGV
jgi:hypothetical protein